MCPELTAAQQADSFPTRAPRRIGFTMVVASEVEQLMDDANDRSGPPAAMAPSPCPRIDT
jgi:hypothetical protein